MPRRRDELGAVVVEARDGERTRTDGLAAERKVREVGDRDAGQQVGRRDRLGRGLEETAERIGQAEDRRSARRFGTDGHLVP